jgi:hypothetical protein
LHIAYSASFHKISSKINLFDGISFLIILICSLSLLPQMFFLYKKAFHILNWLRGEQHKAAATKGTATKQPIPKIHTMSIYSIRSMHRFRIDNPTTSTGTTGHWERRRGGEEGEVPHWPAGPMLFK